MQKSCLAAGAIALSSATAPALAGGITYSSQASFLGSLGGSSVTEGYESYAVDVTTGARTISLDHFDISYDGSGNFGVSDFTRPDVGPYAGTQHLEVYYGGGPENPTGNTVTVTTRFSFAEAIDAFGTFMTDVEAAQIDWVAGLAGEGGTVSGVATPSYGDGLSIYFGINAANIGERIEWVEFSMSTAITGYDGVFFDETTVSGSTPVVPGPQVAGVLVLGALAAGRRRR